MGLGLLALLCLASVASAQDGGVPLRIPGFTVEPATSVASPRMLWMDSQRRIVARDPVHPNQLHCWDVSNRVDLGALAGTASTRKQLGVRLGADTWTVMEVLDAGVKVWRVSCLDVPGQVLGELPLAGALVPTDFSGPLPMEADGALLYPAAGGIARLSLSPALSASLVLSWAELEAALGLSLADAGVSSPRVSGLLLLPDGRLQLAVALRGGTSEHWVLERSTGGALAVRWGPRVMTEAAPELLWHDALGATLLTVLKLPSAPGETVTMMGVLPGDGGATGGPLPPGVYGSIALLGSSAGDVYGMPSEQGGPVDGKDGVYGVEAFRFGRLVSSPALADFDHDGLRASREAQRGTSDFVADSDGDGLGDGSEVDHFQTDPLDAASAPAADGGLDEAMFAPSVLAGADYLGPPFGRQSSNGTSFSCSSAPSWSWAPLMCTQGRPGENTTLACLNSSFHTCYTPELSVWMSHETGRFASFPRFTADGDTFIWSSGSVWLKRSLSTGTQEFLSPAPNPTALPLTRDRALFSTDGRLVQRLGGGERLAVFDRERTSCSFVSSDEELTRCGEPELFTAAPTSVNPVGYDARFQQVLFQVRTGRQLSLYGVGTSHVRFLADLTGTLPLQSMLALPGGGYLVQHRLDTPEGSWRKTARWDAAYRDTGLEQPWLNGLAAPRAWFRHGFPDTYSDELPLENEVARRQSWSVEWVPVAPAIEPGEVLFWAPRRQKGGPPLRIAAPGGGFETLEAYRAPGWLLWRMTPKGGVAEWLRADQFIALLPAADRAELTAKPLGPILGMGASAEGTRFCLAEPEARRVWELRLDPGTRRPASAGLVARDAGAGCAYDEAGTLAVLSASPAQLRVGGRVLPLGAVEPAGLLRLAGRWFVQVPGEGVRCVRDSGEVVPSPVRATALTEALGALAYLDEQGHGFIARPDEFCATGAHRERLTRADTSTWERLYSPRYTTRRVTAPRASLAFRPDGLFLLGAWETVLHEVGTNSELIPQPVFHLFPRYEPLSAERRLGQFDPFRLQDEVFDVISMVPSRPGALVTVPGASAERDWGYHHRPGLKQVYPGDPIEESPADGGLGDGGAEDGGLTDGGAEDGGLTDGGAEDGGLGDGGSEDGGLADGGAEDGGLADGGAEDGGLTDGGAEDGGLPDDSPEPPGSCGCASADGALLALLSVLLPLLRRRRA